MKTKFILLIACVLIGRAFAQEATVVEPSLKYGKPSNEELSMTTYAPDTSAVAVILYKKTEAMYELVNYEFRLNYYHEVKIKILKPEGTSSANISIPYYENINNTTSKEFVTQIDASAYNLEGGKMERTKMKKEFVFKERIDDRFMQVKFSIPGAKAGSVIEYKYRVLSDFYYNINSWKAQEDIPTLYAEYDIIVPEYFKFNLDMHGTETLKTTDVPEGLSYNINGNLIQCSGRHLNFKGRLLPALRDDGYIFCADDYGTQVNFELAGLDFPGALYKSFTQTWESIDKILLEDNEFGSQLKMRNPFRDEMSALNLDKLTDTHEKIGAIYSFLKQKVAWNGSYSLYGGSSKKTVKEGIGNNAEINFILMSMLRDANINSYPVVMSRRSKGMIPFTHPSIQKLNTFIVGIAATDSTMVYLDGSVRDGFLNVLPPVLMVDRARMILPDNQSKWVNLSTLGKNQLRSSVNATVQPDGKIIGTRTTSYLGQYASELRKEFRTAKDSTEFINQLATREGIQVTGFQTEGLQNFSPTIKEVVNFEKQSMVNDNFIYLNPLVFLHTEKNPFTQSERKLPVEFPYPEQITLSINLTLPEGYTVDEFPQPVQAKTEDGQGICRYNMQCEGNRLALVYVFSSKKLMYLPKEYPGLQNFWKLIADKNNETVVLKKL